MTLREHGIVAFLFRFSVRTQRCFFHVHDWRHVPQRTDLCSLIRTIVLGMPLALAINAVAIAWAVYVFGYLTFLLWLNLTGLAIAVTIVLAVVVIILTTIGLHMVAQTFAHSEAAQVVSTYYRAKKETICPLISFQAEVRA